MVARIHRHAGVLLFGLIATACGNAANTAFVALEGGGWRVFVSNDGPGGSYPVEVGSEIDGDKSAPSLSPDGQSVAFELASRGLLVCRIGGSKDCRSAPASSASQSLARPRWSFGGDMLIATEFTIDQGREDSEISKVALDLAVPRPLVFQTGLQDFADMSRYGQLIFTSSITTNVAGGGVLVDQQLWIADFSKRTVRRFSTTDGQHIHARWDRSGQRVAFSSNRGGRFDLWVADSKGENLRQITSGPGQKTWPTWAPQGDAIMFTLLMDGKYSVWIVTIADLRLRRYEPFGAGVDIQMRDADWR